MRPGAGASEAPTVVPAAASAPEPAHDAAPVELTPGTSIDRFVVLEEMGRGAMGVVVAAVDPKLERKVAIKLLSRELSGGASPEERSRFLQEAKAMAQLSHPHVVTVHHVGTWNDRVFVVMEFVRGSTLRRWLKQDRSVGEIIRVFAGAARGLAAAHRAGIVHRDFKPENVLVGDDGLARVTDFGLAGSSADSGHDPTEVSNPGEVPFSAVAVTLTRSGALMGTPAYMSPEQYRQTAVDGRSDQFGFCIALHEAVYGERPFRAASFAELAANVTHGRQEDPPAGARAPAAVRRVLERGLAVDRESRYPDMESLVAELVRPPWWKRTAVMAGVGGTAVAAAGLAVPLLQGDPCDTGDEGVQGTWDASRQEAVGARFLASGRGHAEATFARVDAALTDYVQSWTTMRREACEASRVDAAQSGMLYDRRMSCLARREGRLRALVDRFAEADGNVVDRAVRAVESLPPTADCGDLDALVAAVAPPEDPTVRKRVEALHAEVDAARAHERLGEYAQGWARIEPVLRQATELDYGPLIADAHQIGGRLAYRTGHDDEAESLVRTAVAGAAKARDARLEVQAWTTLLYVVGYRHGRHEEAAGLLAGAEGALARAGDAAASQGRVDTNYALVLWDAGQLDAARKRGEQAVERLTSAFGADHLEVATALHNLGNVLRDAGEWNEALEVFTRALEIRERVFGPEHPAVASTLNAMGTVQEDLEPEAALSTYRRALAIAQAAFGEQHTRVADIHSNIGNVHNHRREFEKARASLEHAKSIYETVSGKDSADVAQILVNLGNTVGDAGQVRESIGMYERALEIGTRVWSSTHPHLAVIHDVMGNAYIDLGEYATSIHHTTKALEIRQAALPPTHPDIAKTLFNLAATERVTGDYAGAKKHFEASRQLYAEKFGADHPEVASVHEQLGLLHETQERFPQAIEQYEIALRMYTQTLSADALPLASLLRNLGDAQAAAGNPDAALARYGEALAIQRKHLGDDHLDLAYTLQARGELHLQRGQASKALPDLERALAVRESTEGDKFQRALTRFTVARALAKAGGGRTRARQLAESARAVFVTGGDVGAPNVEEIDAWLRRHR